MDRMWSSLIIVTLLCGFSDAYFGHYKEALLNATRNVKISSLCSTQLDRVLGDAATLLQMYDATSKIIYPGMVYGTPMDLGMYDECMKLDSESVTFQHCRRVNVYVGLLNVSYSDSICFPADCSPSDMQLIYDSTPLKDIFPANFLTAICKTNSNLELDTWGIIGTVFFSIIFGLMLTSTGYDVYCKFVKIESMEILRAFSVYSNTKKLLKVSKGSKEQVQIFAGIKFISMMWIIAGHGMAIYPSLPVVNLIDVYEIIFKKYFVYMSASPLAVETFFYISGFLLPYMYLKQFKGKLMIVQTRSVPMLYLHRYLRLTPAVFGIWLLVVSVFKYLGKGPIWSDSSSTQCIDHWWPYFLYIQNYYNYDDMCLIQTWYLSADMQMFIFSPLILIPTAYYINKNYKLVMYSLIGFTGFTIILPMIVKFADREYTELNAYDTHSRLSTYFVGFIFGTYMRMNIDKPFILRRNVKLMNFILWCLSIITMGAVAWFYHWIYMGHWTYEGQTVFYSLMRPIWGIGLSWMVYSSFHGHGGLINSFLSCSAMQIGARLSYCSYLMHPIVIAHFLLSSRVKFYFSSYVSFYEWCGYFIVTMVIAYLWSMMFESPFIIIEKFLFGRGAPKRPPPKEATMVA